MEYAFKRDFYYNVEDSIKNNSVSFLLGPRKCGKTVALKQIALSNNAVEYIDFKTLADNKQKMAIINRVIDSIYNNDGAIYLLDEITYAFHPESEIAKIAEAFSSVENSNVRVVFAGSQSVALEAWGRRAFCGNAHFIHTNFLTYSEWLRYKGCEEISAETYNNFLYQTKDFYKFTTVKDYLSGCLEETVISNAKTTNIIFNNDVSSLNVEMLLDVLYSSLLTRQNKTSPSTFANKNQLFDDISYHFADLFDQIDENDVQYRITSLLSERYKSLKATSVIDIQKALQFLIRCDLITVTPMIDCLDDYTDIQNNITFGRFIGKVDLFEKFIVTINYPMFYVEILKDLFQEKMPKQLQGDVLGGIVECHARGLLPVRYGFEYHDKLEREVDYVNPVKEIVVEISISNKKKKAVHFDCLPDDYVDILLTKNIDSYNPTDKVYHISYYRFLHDGFDTIERNIRMSLVKEKDHLESSQEFDELDEPNL